jgi:hypothetical protein
MSIITKAARERMAAQPAHTLQDQLIELQRLKIERSIKDLEIKLLDKRIETLESTDENNRR